ncbi:MAG TPA: hypothetical protein VIS99_17080 [Terrimicrobiaceae bacterium]
MLSEIAFILYLILPALAWISRKKLLNGRIHVAVLFVFTTITGCLLYVCGVWLIGIELERELYTYDLDGDRVFNVSEITPKMEEAMRRFTTDTGRTLAPIVAGPVTLIWVALNFVIFGSLRWLASMPSSKRTGA